MNKHNAFVRKRSIFEELEPRILYSADAVGVFDTDALSPSAEVRVIDSTENTTTTSSNTQNNINGIEFVFIDSSVKDYQLLLNDILNNQDSNKHIEVILLDKNSDGINQINEILSNYEHITAIHLIGEGTEAEMHLGGSFLNTDSVNNLYADAFRELGSYLSADADILIYGCNFAAGQNGQALVADIANLTGADVAASIDRTGHANEYGNWVLEYNYGVISTDVVISDWGQENWFGALATYTVTNVNDSGAGSLRQAILNANANVGTDNIYFNIIGSHPYTINLLTLLPDITDRVIIDGTTENNFVTNGNKPVIVLNGGGIVQDGLRLYAGSDGSVIRGLIIQNFTQDGIDISYSNDNTIVGNWIGLNSTGTAAAGNAVGINLWTSNNNIIGGTTAADRNVISGNTSQAIFIGNDGSGASGNQILGNYIGTNVAGSAAVGNFQGVYILNSSNNIIGSAATGGRNIISASTLSNIEINGINATGNIIQSNYIGTDVTGLLDINGTAQAVGQNGIALTNGANNNLIGTNADGINDAAERNIISGNNWTGIDIVDNSSNNTIQGNWIGVDATGNTALGNIGIGVSVYGVGTGNQIGSGLAGAGNVISGNGTGVWLSQGASNNKVQGNMIGLGADGNTVVGNINAGIELFGGNINTVNVTGNIIGTDADGLNDANERNIISGNGGNGILLGSIYTTGNTIAGNYIGTDSTGLLDRGNTVRGVQIENGANHNIIGGAQTSQRNVISGNAQHGVLIQGATSASNTVQGNWLGINAAGTATLGNDLSGITVIQASGTHIGGTLNGQGNWIAGNLGSGIEAGSSALGTLIQGNRIGTDLTGTLDWGNFENGIYVWDNVNVTIGGAVAGAGNIVAFNGKGGVWTSGISIAPNATFISILGNSIYNNAGIGIDLGDNNAVDLNDVGDADVGGNFLQNFPVLTSAVYNGSDTVITGSLNSNVITTYRIEFFSNASGTEDPTGYGEGRTYLGFTDVTTDVSGNASFNTTLLGVAIVGGDRVTATATVKTGAFTYASTSEFGMNVIVANTPPAGIDTTINVTEDTDYVFTLADFSFTDVENNGLLRVYITTLPAQGTLKYLGTPFDAGNYISLISLQNGEFTYSPPTNAEGNNLTSFTFQVQDDGGTANGGVDTDPSPNTITYSRHQWYRDDRCRRELDLYPER
jgi:hypothetical protein